MGHYAITAPPTAMTVLYRASLHLHYCPSFFLNFPSVSHMDGKYVKVAGIRRWITFCSSFPGGEAGVHPTCRGRETQNQMYSFYGWSHIDLPGIIQQSFVWSFSYLGPCDAGGQQGHTCKLEQMPRWEHDLGLRLWITFPTSCLLICPSLATLLTLCSC